ncbi:MAG TPA: hypothetical protein VF526_09575 [Solirubrobacteraceae bacterium]|jgi:hypothetical protein
MTGPGGTLAVTYSILALAAGARSLTQITTHLHEAPLAYGLSAVAAAIYLLIAVALRAPSSRWRQTVLVACAAELAGVLTVGCATVLRPSAFTDESVWSHFGEGYAYLPLALPVLTLVWLTRESSLPRT